MIWFHQNYGIPTPFLLLTTPPCPPHRLSHPFLPFVSQSCAVWSLLLLNWNFLSGVINKLLVKCDDPSKSSPTSASLYHLGVLLELSSFDLSHVMCPESPRPSPTGPPHLPLPVSPPRPSLSLTLDLSQCHGLHSAAALFCWLPHPYFHLWSLSRIFYPHFQTFNGKLHMEKVKASQTSNTPN